MIRLTALLLVLTMVLSLAACGGSAPAETEAPAATEAVPTATETVPEETAPPESAEIQAILAQGWVPEGLRQNLDKTIRWDEMIELLESAIVCYDPMAVEAWHAVLISDMARNDMERDEGMLAIYEAACALGIGNKARNNWLEVNAYYNNHCDPSDRYDPSTASMVFNNLPDPSAGGMDLDNANMIAPYENNPGQQAGWDYITCARFYSMGQSSGANPEPFFAYSDEDTRYDDPLTRREAITAAAKLIQAYEAVHSGGYVIPETDWEDPLLAEAKTAREAILNSPTAITKGEKLVLGETYTGTAYYVSNSGDDGNDGQSPETAWATLKKVAKAKLKYGDAVFFERGGTWFGQLKMQYGVTYSAYGEGAKPILTGAPLDSAQEDKWTLHAETADGGKIWQYSEPMMDAGVILLNGGEVVARKAYPIWNEKEYTNADGEPYIVEEELADLMFFSALNLRGVKLWDTIEGDGRTGTLYLRCDAGNPGAVFEKIEIAVLSSGTTTADKGWNAVDNLYFHCYATSGMDCNNHSNIVYQNCETDWCGGAIKYYRNSWYNPEDIMITVSGGGMLLFGSDLTCKNNYIHDCESKGIAIVTNFSDGNRAWLKRDNLLAQGNVVERCGMNVYMWVDSAAKGKLVAFEDIRFTDNYFVNGGYGWHQMNKRDLTDADTQSIQFQNVLATGEVLFENNLFYRGLGALVNLTGDDLQGGGAVLPALRGNTYVQDKNQLLFGKRDELHDHYPETTLATSDQAQMEACVRDYMGDTTGKVIILE